MKYRVGVKEIWEQMYEVEADSPDEARVKVENHFSFSNTDVKFLEDEFELSSILESDEWYVWEEKK